MGLLAAALLAAAGVWTLGAVPVARHDEPPAGPSCDYELDEGSGPAGSGGREEVRWGYLPTKVCVADLPGGDRHEDPIDQALLLPAMAPLVFVAVLAGGNGVLLRRVPRSRRG